MQRRMALTKVLLHCFLVTLTARMFQGENIYNAKVRLENMLLKNYRKEVRPVLDDKDNVTITVGISLYHIKSMDDKNQILTTSLWIRQKWNDPRLTWKPSNFSSAKRIHISSDKVWLPDLKVYNEIDRRIDSGLDQFRTRVIVNHSGNLMWMGPSVLTSSCQVDIKWFPYDTQTCQFKIGSWTFDGFAVDVQPESYTMDISKSPSNPEWELVSTSVKKNVQTYPCCPEPYPDVTYTIKIKRRVQSYWMNFIFPCIFLTIMTMMTFITPTSDTGERISLVLTSLVSMFFFLKMVAERTPTSDTIPLLSIYFVMLSFEIGLIFYSVCVTLNAYHKHPSLGDMPLYVRSLVLEKLARFWGLTKEGQAISRKLAALRNLSLMKDTVTHKLEQMKRVPSNPETPSTNGFVERRLSRERDYNCNNSKEKEVLLTSFTATHDDSKFSDGEVPNNNSLPPALDDGDSIICPSSNDPLELNTQCRASQSNLYRSSQQNPEATPDFRCLCPSLLQEMVAANKRLLSSVREILFVARQLDKKASEKEHWLLAAAILDRAFLVLFVLIFIVVTLANFLK